MTIDQFIKKYKLPCEEAKWLRTQHSLKSAWNNCLSSDWMLSVLMKMGYNDKKMLYLFACWCIRNTPLADGRTVWDLLINQGSQNAINIAEQYINGKTTLKEAEIARDTAWVAILFVPEGITRFFGLLAAGIIAATILSTSNSAWMFAFAITCATWIDAPVDIPIDADIANIIQANRLRDMIPWSVVEELIKKDR